MRAILLKIVQKNHLSMSNYFVLLKVQQLKIPVKEGPTVLVPHPILSPCTLSHNFSIGANSELFRISFLCCEHEQSSLSGRLEIHFSLFVTGYDPSLVDGSGPAMGIEVRIWFVVKVFI